MKTMNIVRVAAVAVIALVTTASAIPVRLDTAPYAPPQLTDPVNSGDDTVRDWLQGLVTQYNTIAGPGGQLPVPVGDALISVGPGGAAPSGYPTFGAGVLSITIPLGSYDYVALRWGGNQNCDNWQAFYIGNDTESYTFNAPGRNGLSDYRLYHERENRVPDGGSTAALLGMALTGFGIIRRRIFC